MSQVAAQPLVEIREAEIPEGTSAELAALLMKRSHVPVVDGQFAPDSLEGYSRLAEGYLKAGLVPDGLVRGLNDPKARVARVALVLEAGMGGLRLTAIQSMSYLMVVNNRVGVWGDAVPGLVLRSGSCAGIDEKQAGEKDEYAAVCTMKRMNKLPDGSFVTYEQSRTFSIRDAKRAGLWEKAGPWKNYPQRMLQTRARAFAARDMFPDALMGLGVVEEMIDAAEPSPAVVDLRARTASLDAPKVNGNGHHATPIVPTRMPEPAAESDAPSVGIGDANAQPPADVKLGEGEPLV